ncbi:MAG: histidine kinase [Cryomorphaceae bacterium]|nr:histidine kinase [Cryomorphaceae bacterium]
MFNLYKYFFKKNVVLVFTMFFVVIGFKIRAQQYVFDEVGRALGVNVPLVNRVYEDKNGYFWLPTMGDGLLWWNGRSFVEPYAENSLSNDYVLDVCSYKNDVFILTEQTLERFDGRLFVPLQLPFERFLRMRVIDGEMYLLSQRSGIWHFQDDTLVKRTSFPEDVRMYDFQFKGNEIWLATSKGLWHLNDRFEVIDKIMQSESLRVLKVIDSSKILVGGENGLFSVDPIYREYYSVFSNAEVRAITSNGEDFWVGTDGDGIWKGNSKGVWINRRNGLENLRIRSLYFDKLQRLWITTTDGVWVMAGENNRFYPIAGGVNRGFLSSNNVQWLSSSSRILRIEDEREEEVLDVQGGVILAIQEDGEGNVIFGGENGLLVLSSEGKHLSHWKDEFPDPFVTAMHFVGNTLFVGSASRTYRISNYKNALTFDEVLSEGVSHLASFSDTLYALTHTSGLVSISKSGEISQRTSFAGYSLKELMLTSMSVNPEGNIWLGTSNKGGFIRENGKWSKLDLQVESIFDWYNLGDQGMLATTESEVIVVKKDGRFWSHPFASTFPLGYLNRSFPMGKTKDEVFFSTNEGVVVLGISAFSGLSTLRTEIFRIDLYFDSHTRWQDKSGELRMGSGVPQEMQLAHYENYLRFLFGTAEIPLLSGFLEYRYRMTDLDPNWIETGEIPEAVYTNIQPGRYIFEVQARWPGNTWGGSVDTISLIVIPPWYKTTIFYILAGLTILLLTIAVVRYRSRQISEKIRLENAVLANERIALRLQMNPHFLFNALESIGNFVLKNDTESTMKYLNSFTKLMRLTLEAGTDKDHPVESEITLLKSYVVLEQLRFNHSFEVFFEVDEEIDYDIAIPPMLVQPHVENAILHGLRYLEGRRGALWIRFFLEDDRLMVEVEDNGVGRAYNREQVKRKTHRSMALEINRKRIELLSKSFNRELFLKIIDLYDETNRPTGTKIIISLPIIYLDAT